MSWMRSLNLNLRRALGVLVVGALAGCAADDPTPDPASTTATPLAANGLQAVFQRASGNFGERNPLPAFSEKSPPDMQRIQANVPADECSNACGPEKVCAALCRIGAFDPSARRDFEPGEQASRPQVDCLACGRETGFQPAPDGPEPISVEAVVDDKGSIVLTWTGFEGAEAYELWVLRGRGDGTPAAVFNRTVVGTQTRLSQLETGWRWYFSVTPLVDGDLVEAARGESEPIDL
jgi:hypothetical protein